MTKNEFQGYRLTEKHVVVCWTRRSAAATRFESVSIPWSDLVEDKDFLDAFGAQVAKALRAAWASEPEDYPLF